MKGIDVSYSQKSVDWLRAAADGVQFVVIRAGYGNDPAQQDAMFAEHIAGAIRAGLPVAVYWMAYPVDKDDARAEWAACKQIIAEYKDKIRFVAYDYEGASREYYAKIKGTYPDRDVCSAMVDAFLSAAKSDGYKPMLYINNDFRKNYITADVLAAYPLWLADYTDGPDAPCAIQQTTSTGTVDGVSGNVDCNTAFDDTLFAAPVAVAAVSAQATTSTAPATDVFYRVRAGGAWLPEVCNMQDYAGSTRGLPITGFCVRVSQGTVKYRAHVLGVDWLPSVTGYDTTDSENGYAGCVLPIDAIEIYYYTPDDVRPYRRAKYRVAPASGNYYGWQLDDQTSDGQDGYAGVIGTPVARLQICVE